MIKNIIKLLKPKHHIKNIIIFLPLFFSFKFIEIKNILITTFVFFSFCLIASAVYVLNDILDIESDKNHPIKKNRPIASGKISIKLGYSIFTTLCVSSIAIALYINKLTAFIIVCYLLLNIFYSKQLKYLPIIDVITIALGFILRILSGCSAILVVPSPLIILLTFFTSMFFTFSKRKLEYQLISDKKDCRASIKEYNTDLLNQYIAVNAVLSIAFYFTYMLDPYTIEKTNSPFLYLTVIPFSAIIFRLLFKIFTCSNNDDPAEFIYKDTTIKDLSLIYLIVLFTVLFI